MTTRIDAATLLERALATDADRVGLAITLGTLSSTRWASATFVGARHRMTIEGAWCEAAGVWLDGLPDADLPLRGHLVADLALADRSRADGHFTATIEALTVEEA